MRLHQLSCFGLAALALGLAPACNGGQTGDLSGNNDGGGLEGSANGCVEHREELGDFDEQTDAGSAAELLSYAERSFDAPLRWQQATDQQSWSLSPESGAGTVHLAITRGTKAYKLTYTQPENQSGQELGAALLCPPSRLGVEASVTVSTDGGALAESFDTLLRSDTAGVASVYLPLDLAKLNGALAAQSREPNAKLVQLRLEAVLSPAGTTGSISGIEQVSHGSGPDGSTSATAAELAVWPGGAACEAETMRGDGLDVTVDDEVLGATGSATLAEVTPSAAVKVTWQDGSQTSLEVAIAVDGDGCFRVSDSPVPQDAGPLVTYPVTFTLKSDDGRLDGSYRGRLQAQGSGDARRVAASAYLNLPVAQLAESGFSDATLPSGTESVLVQLEASSSGGSASGSVNLFALSSPPCVTEPQVPSGSGSAPCAGQTQTRVETASWGD